jgi:hypothetical protein
MLAGRHNGKKTGIPPERNVEARGIESPDQRSQQSARNAEHILHYLDFLPAFLGTGFTASFSAFAARNTGTLVAGIFILALV